MSTEKRRVRYLRSGDETGSRDLIAEGYEFRGISKKGSQIFVLADRPSVEQDIDALETTFGLERDLQHALRSNIEQLEPGLKIADEGKEQTIAEVGRIDITAQDHEGTTVVIELKAGTADREVIGQVLSYMGGLSDTKKAIRGILIAGDFTSRATAAARAVPNLRLMKYKFKFTFELVGENSTKDPPK